VRVFVAGATGAIGRRLVPLLVDRGHDVSALTHTPGRDGPLRAAGATPVVADGLDRDAVVAAVRRVGPDVVVHEMTALAGGLDMRRFEQTFARTNELRTRGTDNLLEAARAAGARRFVVQSFAGWPFARTGGPVKTEEDPLDPHPPPALRTTLEAIRHLEGAVGGAEGIEGLVLRYGGFYGPGTSLAPDGEHTMLVRKRRWPIVGGGTGVWSVVHIDDAAAATVQAIERGRAGIYNIVDDEPAPVHEWLPYLAEVLGAKPPLRVPVWVGRAAAGEHGVAMMTSIRGASNAKAKRELGWTPRYASWREGFRTLAGPRIDPTSGAGWRP
jgi:nucleoside-diphosphate-sugar epimerase